ncbi:MAG: NYN domain-containing protein [Planctomycetota bacterium]
MARNKGSKKRVTGHRDKHRSVAIPTKRTFVYIDGFNLYYGIRDAELRRFLWLDVLKLANSFMQKDRVLSRTKYFTARIRGVNRRDTPDEAKARESSRLRQKTYLEAVQSLPATDVIEGHFLWKNAKCGSCNSPNVSAEEKLTDVNIASEMLCDAFLGRFDLAIVVSGDSDLSPPIERIRQHFPAKPVFVAFPPKRQSEQLKAVATSHFDIAEDRLRKCQFPDQLTLPSGVILNRPKKWAPQPPGAA